MTRRNVRDIPPTLRSATTVSCHWEPRDAVCVIMAMFRRANGVIQLIYFYAKNNFRCMYYYVFVVLFILVLFTVNALKTVKFLVKKLRTQTHWQCNPARLPDPAMYTEFGDLCPNSTYSICCGFVVQQVLQQICDKSIAYNKSTTSRHVEMLGICCTTNPSPQQIHNKSKQWSLDSICCGLVVASLPIRELMLKTY